MNGRRDANGNKYLTDVYIECVTEDYREKNKMKDPTLVLHSIMMELGERFYLIEFDEEKSKWRVKIPARKWVSILKDILVDENNKDLIKEEIRLSPSIMLL